MELYPSGMGETLLMIVSLGWGLKIKGFVLATRSNPRNSTQGDRSSIGFCDVQQGNANAEKSVGWWMKNSIAHLAVDKSSFGKSSIAGRSASIRARFTTDPTEPFLRDDGNHDECGHR